MRILVIEHEPGVGELLRKGLEGENFSLDLTEDPEEGLAWAAATDYDALILGVQFHLDGLNFVRKLRKSGNGLRILMIGARHEPSEVVKALQSGADDYLAGTFSIDELLARIYALLRRPRRMLDKLVVGDLELDRMRLSVIRAGKAIKVTAREFGVLEYLMRNAGKPVTRTMIVEHVWDLAFEGLTNIVDVYINYLRVKIDRGFSRSLIRTVRGIGYMLEDSSAPEASPTKNEYAASPPGRRPLDGRPALNF